MKTFLAFCLCILAITANGAYQFNPITTNSPAGMTNVINQVAITYPFVSNNQVNVSFVNERIGNGYITNYTQFDSNATAPAHAEGRVFYDPTQHTLTYYNEATAVSVNIAQEQLVRVRNTTGSQIDDGTAVYITGATGQTPTVAKAIATNLLTSCVIGLTTMDIPHNNFGYVTVAGMVNSLNTSMFTDGNMLFLSTNNPGLLTNVQPANPNYCIHVGTCAYAHLNQGKILVHPNRGSVDWINVIGSQNVITNYHSVPVFLMSQLSVTNLGAGYALGVIGTNETYVTLTESTTADLFNRWRSKTAAIEWGIWSNALYFQALAGASNGINFFVDPLSPDYPSVRFHSTNGVTATNFVLESPQWVDVPMNYGFSVLGPSAPALTAVSPTSPIQGLAFDNGDILYAQAQWQHNLASTNAMFPQFIIYPHVHFSTVGAGLPDLTHSNVTWQIEWEWASINNFFTNSWSSGTNSFTFGVYTNYMHYLANLGPITNVIPPGISAIFRCRLTRPASALRDYSNAHDVILDAMDVHIPVGNTRILGSRSDSAP